MSTMYWLALGIAAMEGVTAWHRFHARQIMYAHASRVARELQRPLVVVGAPRAGMHTRLVPAYGCGDVCIDLVQCECPRSIQADLTRGPVSGIVSDSAVVFCSCVLEYTTDPYAAWEELVRMAGSPDRVCMVSVEPWCLTSVLYPDARWMITRQGPGIHARPVTFLQKSLYAGGLGAVAFSALSFGG